MGTLLTIILFPLKLVVLILAYILRAVLFLTGYMISFISNVAGGILCVIGGIVSLAALVLTVQLIIRYKNGEIPFKTAAETIGLSWGSAAVLESVGAIGIAIGEFLMEIGETLTDNVKDFLFI